MKYIVYLTTNKVNNKIYVGVHKTEDPTIFDGYIGCSINIFISNPELKHPKTPFHKAIKKYGYNAFIRNTIQVFDSEEEALELEAIIVNQDFIERDDTYNISKISDDSIKEDKVPSQLNKINKRRKIGQYTMDGELVKEFNTLREAKKEFPNVSKVLRGEAKHCHNFKFKYLE